MMDAHDTNQPLNQGELEEEKKTVEVSEAITETPTEEVTARGACHVGEIQRPDKTYSFTAAGISSAER